MLKKIVSYFLMGQIILFLAWLSSRGIIVTHEAVRAFVFMEEVKEEFRATAFLGAVKELTSKERTLDLQVITRKQIIEITQKEYEDLLRIVEAEAGGEDLKGKMLVANVIINRVEDERFPDTVSEVIFQEEEGRKQFSPIADGRFYHVKISEETVEAVNLVLAGEDNSRGALYFAARKAADPNLMEWFDDHLTRLFAHGGHEFFL